MTPLEQAELLSQKMESLVQQQHIEEVELRYKLDLWPIPQDVSASLDQKRQRKNVLQVIDDIFETNYYYDSK